MTGFRLCTYTKHVHTHNWQTQAPARLNAYSSAHTHACSIMQESPHTHAYSHTVSRRVSALWEICLLEEDITSWRQPARPAPLAKLSYCGYGSGKLKQPSQEFRVLWKCKSQVQVVNELWEGERWGKWVGCCCICRRYNCQTKRRSKQTDEFWEWRLPQGVFFFSFLFFLIRSDITLTLLDWLLQRVIQIAPTPIKKKKSPHFNHWCLHTWWDIND